MRRAFWIIALSLLSPGCQLVLNTTRDLSYEFCLGVDETVECSRNRHLAEQAWDEVREAIAAPAFSVDYARGFKDGYADYLTAGGSGDPPSLPPRCYWKAIYQTPEGKQATDDWFTGFRHGAWQAKSSGLRRVFVVPSSLPPPPPAPIAIGAPALPPADEVLPSPRPVEPEPGAPSKKTDS